MLWGMHAHRSSVPRFTLLSLAVLMAACVPHRDYPPDQIKGLTKLSDVMDVQATIADPQMKKADQGTYTDEDWAAFADVGNRIQVTSTKIHDFSKGPEFDGLANQLNMQASALSAAAQTKDAAKASAALTGMKAVCKECHSKFK